jgi:hypothetical protein
MKTEVPRLLDEKLFVTQLPELAGSEPLQETGSIYRCQSTTMSSQFPRELGIQGVPKACKKTGARLERAQRRVWRFLCALCGGLTLLLPTLIMAFAGERVCALITTPTCIVLFAALVTWTSAFEMHVIFTITMAYSTALVIIMSSMV